MILRYASNDSSASDSASLPDAPSGPHLIQGCESYDYGHSDHLRWGSEKRNTHTGSGHTKSPIAASGNTLE